MLIKREVRMRRFAMPLLILITVAFAAVVSGQGLVDVNATSKAQLELLTGPQWAEAIVKGRPYADKQDLLQKQIVPETVYNKIKDRIIARRAVPDTI